MSLNRTLLGLALCAAATIACESDSDDDPPVGGTPVGGVDGGTGGTPLGGVDGGAGGTPVGGEPVGGTPVGGTPVGGAPVGGTPVGGSPVGGEPVGGTPVGGEPVGGTPVGGTGGSGGSPPPDCAADACGDQPPFAGMLCWDGSVVGLVCMRGDDGVCRWEADVCPPEGDPCTLPLEVGDCDAAIPSWGYDGRQGGCVEFSYGGCGGNANRFETLEACQASCGGGADVACGGRAGNTCTGAEFCQFGPRGGCGFDDGQGLCRPRPEVCAEIFAPVCGCDGQTYSNECFAAGGGADVQYEGPCEGSPGEACSDLSRDPIVVGGTLTYGFCANGCQSTLAIVPTALDRAPPCDEVLLTVCDNGAGAPCTEHRGFLTPAAHDQARNAARALVGVPLMDVYGCPDCADGGARTVELERDGVRSSHSYEAGQAPPELADADALVRGVIDALRTCVSSAQVDVFPGCVPRP